MSQSAPFLLSTRGQSRDLGAFVVAARFSRDGSRVGFALGDGSVWTMAAAGDPGWTQTTVHDGAILDFAADPAGQGFISAGDDGQVRRLDAEGHVSDVASFGMKWVEHVATYALDKGKGLIAASAGKVVRLFDQTGRLLKELTHPSTVTGLTFDGKGKRVVASHYNGVSIWFVAAKTDTPRKLEWKGSHTAVAMHPEGEAVVTAMQENALHGWKLPDGQHMRMSGYPAKTASLSFSRNGKWLATSGADAMVLWPFFGGGPMGKAPLELAGGDGVVCTRVAANPANEIVAGGFTDGLVVVADINSSRILPVVPPEHGPISTLAWNPDGTKLAVGTETGFAAVVDFTKR
ncbi:MAG TPA: WD40 repeat domain-containing protein [Rhodopila sp.]|uniref:WD40 repeat domain-containing protein n=1 Tax=Rhodopila sp. TaxID=2480087 RepID=UPI002BE07515|nr:WD40 repeat domain-containing protein [Rhodopila sp.]HVY17996.1 WD40 repeat domain-containing protein [Rhodopila sp.]